MPAGFVLGDARLCRLQPGLRDLLIGAGLAPPAGVRWLLTSSSRSARSPFLPGERQRDLGLLLRQIQRGAICRCVCRRDDRGNESDRLVTVVPNAGRRVEVSNRPVMGADTSTLAATCVAGSWRVRARCPASAAFAHHGGGKVQASIAAL